jgi:hypothetical protein
MGTDEKLAITNPNETITLTRAKLDELVGEAVYRVISKLPGYENLDQQINDMEFKLHGLSQSINSLINEIHAREEKLTEMRKQYEEDVARLNALRELKKVSNA